MSTLKERVYAALLEAGYPNARVTGTDDDPSVALSGPHAVPDRACWMAFHVARYPGQPCWECWSADKGHECDHGGNQ